MKIDRSAQPGKQPDNRAAAKESTGVSGRFRGCAARTERYQYRQISVATSLYPTTPVFLEFNRRRLNSKKTGVVG
jgi:hypothetical protein